MKLAKVVRWRIWSYNVPVLASLAKIFRARARDCDEDNKICLLEISPSQEYVPPQPDTILCINVHENETALADAVAYTRQVCTPEPGSRITFIPRLFALINVRQLSPQQRWQVNKELIPAGASIFPYPKGCETFEGAMHALKAQLIAARRQYIAARKNLRTPPPEQGASILVDARTAATAIASESKSATLTAATE
jgi:hypothetical protein